MLFLACAIAGSSIAGDAVALSAIIYLSASYGTSPNRQAVLGGNLSLFGYCAAEGCERGRLTEIEWLDDPAVCQR